MNEKTINICGKEVRMLYCAATEKGFEQLSDSDMSVFSPKFGKDYEGNDIVLEPARAKSSDYITLATAAIIAAYSRTNEEPPISSEDILYNASASEIAQLMTTVAQLRMEWYSLPKTVADKVKQESEGKTETAKN